MGDSDKTMSLVLGLVIIIWMIPVNSESVMEVVESTLLLVKQQWGNPTSLSSWSNGSTESPCSWHGITCSSDNYSSSVTGIILQNSNINSPIPPSICKLQNLTYLDLSWNLIPGGFPTSLYKCSSLSYLNLSGNYFSGPIPDDLNNNLSSLRFLDLSANNFSGDVPSSIGALTHLRSLYLSNNLLNRTFPPQIGSLSNLQELSLSFNPFTPTALPPQWGKLNNLKLLVMTSCNLVGQIPHTFGGMQSLEHLDLAENQILGGIPAALFQLTNLSDVYLHKNNLSGEIPSSVQSLNLIDLDLSENNLTGSIPEDFGKLKRLKLLKLYKNNLDGGIPSSIGLLPELEVFRVFYNNLSGPLPTELGLHSHLQQFEIDSNRFSGPLPQHLCYNGALTGVTAFSNNLSGAIPKTLENCETLGVVMLYNNNFTSEVPRGIWTLPKVEMLMLSFNGLTGQLPDRISQNLTRLEVDNNELSGTIPAGIETWTSIRVFKAGNNKLSGSVPLGLTSLSNLISLSLQGNQLSGSLPQKINSWASLSTLNLAGNSLSGEIPSELATVSTLNYLDLSSNDLSGEIPSQLGNLKLTFLNLSNNELTGQIPYSFVNQAFSDSFLNNTNLCTSSDGGTGTQMLLSVPKCSVPVETSSKHNISSKYLAIILVLAVIILLTALYFALFVINELRQRKRNSKLTSWKLTPFLQRLEFTEDNIVSSLSEQNVIGSGGSGKVYRVPIPRSGKLVAVKKIWSNQTVDNSQFLAEVEILGRVRHSNIVKLLCCVCSEDTKLLVYEYMGNQSLDRWINKRTGQGFSLVLDWPTRIKVAIDAAQGLCYLHHDCSPPIIHRDVKSSNILLDSDFNAKISDFGLAKMTGELPSTPNEVAGSFGYMAPECRSTNKVNEKIDVYSFGVVLLELATGKEANGEEGLNLAEWSWKQYKEERGIGQVLDEEISKQQCNIGAMENVFKLGLMCTSTSPSSRPSIKEVLQMLRRFNPPPPPPTESDSVKPKTVNCEREVAPLLTTDNHFSTQKEEDGLSMV